MKLPRFFKKLLLSFLIVLIPFFSVAPNFLVANACVTNFECAANPNAGGCVPNPNAGAGQQSSICSTAVTTGVSNAVSNALNGTSNSTWYNPGPLDFFLKVFDKSNNDIFGERYTYAQVTWIAYSLVGVVAGFSGNLLDIPSIIQQIQANPSQGMNILDQSTKLAAVRDPIMNIISQFYLSPPASGMYWLSQKINNFSIVKTAYAAPSNGFGYSSLQIFLPLWSASRNVAYILMIVIVLAVAFAVMFRLKISPQLVVTVQSALPKIAVTLIVVTFSYAIVGFLIDLMYLVFGAVTYGISNAGGLGPGLNAQDLFNKFLNGSLFAQIGWGAGISIGLVAIALIALTIASGGTLLPFLIGLLVAVLIFFVKTFIMLAQTYLSLIINLVFGPIIILAEAIPFIKPSALDWFKSVVADILVFLAVGLLFLAQALIDGALGSATGGSVTWAPPYVGFSPIILRIMIWIGVWSILPNIRTTVYRMMERTAAEVQLPREFAGQGEAFQRGLAQYTGNERFMEKWIARLPRWLQPGGLRGD